MSATVWLRAETKEFEHRTALVPEDAAALLAEGHEVVVENSEQRVFPDSEYKELGCKIAPAGSWTDAPPSAYILGLKELPTEHFALSHNHIYFAHVYKGQDGADLVLKRFLRGKGVLFDIEFLTDENKRRIAAFGHWAGFVGAAVAVDTFCKKQLGHEISSLSAHPNQEELIEHLKSKLSQIDITPKVIIIRAVGRCGRGAAQLLENIGIKPTTWDYEETKSGGPFSEILEHDIFINTVFIGKKIPPFINKESLKNNSTLSVIADVSCDPTSDINPLPIYSSITSCKEPTVKVPSNSGDIDLIAIDHLPSLLPKESSEDFSSQLLPHLLELLESETLPCVWKNSFDLFCEHRKRLSPES